MLEVGSQLITAPWVASFGESRAHDPPASSWVERVLAESRPAEGMPPRALQLGGEPGQVLPLSAAGSGCGVVFDGVLYNRLQLHEQLLGSGPPMADDAQLVLRAYLRWGEGLLQKIKGIFALCVWDSRSDSLLCARDPIGVYPLFYAEAGPDLLLSTSLETLARHPRVSSAVNRAALAEYVNLRWDDPEETYFEAVRRVPPGHVLRVGTSGLKRSRYWNPVPADEPPRWVTEDEVGRFDALLNEAVDRCLDLGPTGVLLSGGLDSVSVAAVAVDNSRRRGLPLPWALSLLFAEDEASEGEIQRSVAASLGMQQVLMPFDGAVGSDDWMDQALRMCSEWPAPLINRWSPVYDRLILEGKSRGCRVIMTGNGGDELLTVDPVYAADLMRSLDVVGLYHLMRGWYQSYPISPSGAVRRILWRHGARRLLRSAAAGALHGLAPEFVQVYRCRRLAARRQAWAAPDPALRRELDRRDGRLVEKLAAGTGPGGFYLRSLRQFIESPLNVLELEEFFERSRRLGLRILHPLWDADLVDFLYRTPPKLLFPQGGRSKDLVRQTLARRFPELGFERQRKLNIGRFRINEMQREAAAAWGALGGAPRLASLGIVDKAHLDAHLTKVFSEPAYKNRYPIWFLLSAEVWLRRWT